MSISSRLLLQITDDFPHKIEISQKGIKIQNADLQKLLFYDEKEKENKSKMIFYVVPNGDTAKLGIDKLRDLLCNNFTL